MADTADPEGRGDISIEHLIEHFDLQVEKLVEAGVPPERIADALKVSAVRTGNLYVPIGTINAAAERLKRVADGKIAKTEERSAPHAGPERRGPGRPWS